MADWKELDPPRLEATDAEIPLDFAVSELKRSISAAEVSALQMAVMKGEHSRTAIEIAQRSFERVYGGSSGALLALLYCCLAHPDDLVRVAASAAYVGMVPPAERTIPQRILEAAISNASQLVRDIAATTLRQVGLGRERLRDLLSERSTGTLGRRAHTSVLVHGTWARGENWWRPGGAFHKYLSRYIPDLYAAEEPFDWTGDYDDHERAVGAIELLTWTNKKLGELRLNWVVGHSHGANLAMLASVGPVSIDRLLLLSCPVHEEQYLPRGIPRERAISVRVKGDLVILADRGAQRFSDEVVTEHVLPIWFLHSATHDPEVWAAHDVPALVGF